MPLTGHYIAAPLFQSLGSDFYDVVEPARFPKHILRYRNQRWAERIGLGHLGAVEWERHMVGFTPLPDNLPQPLAMRYHGHQFDVYNSQLGDGRGFLFAQLKGPEGRLLDLGTKGSGQTPYSRGGDGRLTLKGGVREVLATEMLEALGVYTSKSLSLFETGESLIRGDEPSPTRSSVLVRLNHSHVRIGCFQRQLHHNNRQAIQALLDYSIENLLPSLKGHDDLPLAFLHEVCRLSARLCAQWLVAGFVHGVLNSDNMTVTGESFDYGPYRFLPYYDPSFVAAYFDHTGLYAYGHQPRAVFKNMARLAQCLSVLDPGAPWGDRLNHFMPQLRRYRVDACLRRLSVAPINDAADEVLADSCWDYLAEKHVGFDDFFFDWWGGAASKQRACEGPRKASYAMANFLPLKEQLLARQPRDPVPLSSAYFQQDNPCRLLIEDVEGIWDAISQHDDFSPFDAKIGAIRQMGEALALRTENPGA
ncbi:MAG: YdiU family protein [Myxococcota bacterium]